MVGAMAGSAVLAARDKARQLEIVTLTINNSCNLRCPHCYLQYASENGDLIQWDNISHVLDSRFSHLCIAGKEPLSNKHAAALTSRLVAVVADTGRTSSFITNGLNLRLLDVGTFKRLDWLDVSVDGSSETYAEYRGGSYSKLVRGIEYARDSGLRDLRILHTVSSGNLKATGEALDAALSFQPQHVVVSSFQATRHDGYQGVTMVPPSTLLRALENAAAHLDSRIWLTLDSGYVEYFGDSEAVSLAGELFGDRFLYVDSDPIDRGIIRVTYDGLVLSPFESVHTADYSQCGRPLRDRSLTEWYQTILAEASFAERHSAFQPQCH